MKLQRFSQFITESTNPLTVETVESEISATAHTLLPKKSWTRAKTYLDLDFNALIKRAAVTATEIFTNFGNTINSPNFDPKTIEAEVLKLEQALYSLTNREVDLIMQGVGPLATVALFTFKKTWKEEFLANNAEPYDSPIGKIVGSIINLILNTQSQGAYDDNSGYFKDSVYATQKQIIKAGKPVPPFTIRLTNGALSKYGAFKYIDGSSVLYQEYHESPHYPGKSNFADGSTIDGCYNLDYWKAIWELLNDHWPRIVKTIVTNIAAKVFA